MTDADGLVAAYLLDGKGGGTELDWPAVRDWSPEQGLLWVHLDYTAPHSRQWLREQAGLTAVSAEALVAEETRPRSAAMEEGLLIILRGVNSNPGQDPEDMVSLRMWVERGRIITTRKRRLLSVVDLRESLAQGRGPASAAEFVVRITDRLVARMSRVIDGIDDTVAELEDSVLTEQSQGLRMRLAALRRQTIILRRYLAPQREALAMLLAEQGGWFEPVMRVRLREVADRLTRFVEELDAARERAAVTGEELASRLSEQLNQRMYVLSLVAVVFLPLGFLTGLLGVNVGGIPGAADPQAFVVLILLLLAVGLVQLIVFRWKRWL